MAAQQPLELVSGDGKAFRLTTGMIDQSEMLMAVGNGTKQLKLNGTNEKCMALVVQWLRHHENDTRAQKDARGIAFSRLPNWDAEFFLKLESDTMNGMYGIATALEIGRMIDYMNTMKS